MAANEFCIPVEFSKAVREIEVQDTRTDNEIFLAMTRHVSVTTEKNIWAFWHGGLEHMPPWCQRNVFDWVRMCDGWTIRVLDMVPGSPNNALKFVPGKFLPEAFVQGEMTGPYRGQHSKDLLSCACLYLYGGAFLDVGILLLRHLDLVGWNKLEDPECEFQIAIPLRYGQQIANHFIMSRKGDPFILRWHELFLEVWKGRREFNGIMDHPLLAFVKDFDFTDPRAAEFKWNVNVDITTVFAYAAQVLCLLRLTLFEGSDSEPSNSSEYWKKNIFLFDALQECFTAEKETDFDGERIYQALSTPVNADPSSEGYELAYRMTWTLLTKASMMKITRGSGLGQTKHLGALWDQNEGKDVEPGTFAALLRYGSIHFQQARPDILSMEAQYPAKTFKKSTSEP